MMVGYELVLAFSAGVFTFTSPCAFLLPAYVSYYLGSNPGKVDLKLLPVLKKSLYFAGPMNLSIISVFTVIGVAVSYLGGLVKAVIPSFQGLVGVVFVLMGVSMWKGWLRLPMLNLGSRGRRGVFTFGVLYTLAIVSCSAPIFISLITYTLSTGGLVSVVTIFWLYSLGVGIPLFVFTVLMVGAGDYALQFTKWLLILRKVASLGLVAVGVYLIYRYYQLVSLSIMLSLFS